MPFLIIGGILLVVVLYFISVFNAFQAKSVKVDEALAGIDNALKKRFDLLTKALEVVKGYAKHEKETFEKVIALRNQNLSTKQLDTELTGVLKGLNVTVENYPELKANTNFLELQASINDVEEHLSAARRFYNAAVADYNQYVRMFPSSIIANMKNYTTKEFFEIQEVEREDVKMVF